MFYIVTKLTGVSQTMLWSERPLSVVLPQFLEWLNSAVAHVSDATRTVHYPGMYYIQPLFTYIVTYSITAVLVSHNGFA